MDSREARQWIREHFAEYVLLADIGIDVPDRVAEVWGDECEKIANRIDRKHRYTNSNKDQPND